MPLTVIYLNERLLYIYLRNKYIRFDRKSEQFNTEVFLGRYRLCIPSINATSFLTATSESLYNVRVCVLLIGNLNSLDHSDSPNDFRFPHVLQKKRKQLTGLEFVSVDSVYLSPNQAWFGQMERRDHV